jgi:two-component system, cell cycle sensor histidine kinase and response regulator CckA
MARTTCVENADCSANGDVRTSPSREGHAAPQDCLGVPSESNRRGTILLVEDEAFVRDAAAEALRLVGYLVFTAKNGTEALDFIGRWGESVDLLLADVAMPGMSGCELAEKFLAQNSRGRVLLMSGRAAEFSCPDSRYSCGEQLDKPFSVEALLAAIQKAITKVKWASEREQA